MCEPGRRIQCRKMANLLPSTNQYSEKEVLMTRVAATLALLIVTCMSSAGGPVRSSRPRGRTSSSSCPTTSAWATSIAAAGRSRRRTSTRWPAGGMRFEYCYSTPLCGPSRCQLLTGRYPFRTGLNSNQSHNAVEPSREVMIPTVLKKAGYVTASVGKWGQICLGPGEWGFDEYLVFPGSGRYWREQTTHYTVNGKQQDLPEGKYLPDIMHQFVVDFIARHKDQPFFLYYPMSHIHGPIVRTPDSKPEATQGPALRRQRRVHGQARRQAHRGARPAAPARKDAGAVHRRQRHGPVRRGAGDRRTAGPSAA